MTTLRVATLNLWGRRGPWRDRLALIRAELGRLSPHLVGLQEVLRDHPEGPSQAEAIAAGLGYEVVYAPAAELDDGTTLGNALLSALPVREHRVLALPTEPGIETRALLYARVETPGGALPVLVTHLDWQPGHGAERLAQVRFIAARAAELAPPGTSPVVMGDFNAGPDTEEIRHLREGAGFTDAWLHGGDGSAGETFSAVNRYARRPGVPSVRIDYIFVGGGVSAPAPVQTELAFRTPRGDVWPSDHFGLVSDLRI